MNNLITKILCFSVFMFSLGTMNIANAQDDPFVPPTMAPTTTLIKKVVKKKRDRLAGWTLYASGIASWYGSLGDGFSNARTASGERMNPYALTCANRWLKFNTYVLVHNINNGFEAICRVNDRGPFAAGRIIDLSYAMKNALHMGGTAPVKIYIKR
ncbi:MAG TPA: septal ring lytic transglycosylase RlpA family protein [Waddliaceae bacterium]